MGYLRSLMATCILVALVPRFICGRPAIDNNGRSISLLNMVESRVPKPDFSDYGQKAVSSFVQGNLPIPRQRRQSDQRRAELETLIGLAKITGKRSLVTVKRQETSTVNPEIIGRRRRSIVDRIPAELVLIYHSDKLKHDGDPTYPLIS